MTNFNDDEDFKYILVSSPRVLKFEIFVVDFALKLLQSYAKSVLFKKASLQQDQKAS